MRVLQISSEATPFAKTGGLADVAGALPDALECAGCDCTLVVPAYREVFEKNLPIQKTDMQFSVPVGQRNLEATIYSCSLPDQKHNVFLIGNTHCFDRDTLYGGAEDYADNAERFIFFSRAALEVAARQPHAFDIIHCHDWQTSLVPAYQKLLYQSWPTLSEARSVLTIHNVAFQGMFWHWDMLLTGFHWKYFNWRQLEFYGQLNMLKAGIVFADQLTTVSPTYAQEIQAAPGGCGLEGVLAGRASDLTGIVNGIDVETWNPRTDELIPRHYSDDDFKQGKYTARVALAARLGHAAPDDRPLVAFVGRLAEQKGVSLVLDLLHRMAGSGNARFIVLGAGDPQLEEALKVVALEHPDAIDVVIGFDEVFAHLIQAAADILLMPSQYEPCGLAQLYAFRYGTIPVVRATGGLVDTVVDVNDQTRADGTASGFVFQDFQSASLEEAVQRALAAHGNKTLWQDLVYRVMHQDWSWGVSAQQYQRVYERALANAPADVVDVR